MTRHYLLRVGDLCSAALNTLIFNGECDESTSGRSYRRGTLYGVRRWQWMQRFVDWLLAPFESEHCRKAHLADWERARRRFKNEGV